MAESGRRREDVRNALRRSGQSAQHLKLTNWHLVGSGLAFSRSISHPRASQPHARGDRELASCRNQRRRSAEAATKKAPEGEGRRNGTNQSEREVSK